MIFAFFKKQLRIREDSSWLAQAFLTFFAINLSLRPSCFNCPYRNIHRPSDITIGDFWQIEYLTGKKDKDGVSFVTVNTDKGDALMKDISSAVHLKEYSLEQVQFRFPKDSTKKPKRYDDFWKTYMDCGYPEVVRKHFDNSFKARLRWEVKKLAKKWRII